MLDNTKEYILVTQYRILNIKVSFQCHGDGSQTIISNYGKKHICRNLSMGISSQNHQSITEPLTINL